MARIRTIKPDFFTSEDIVELSPFARLLYIALWCEADREGRLIWKTGTFKLRYFPGDKISIETIAQELLDRGMVVLYGDGLAYIPTFPQHQHVNPREALSSLPVPDASARVTDASAPVTDAQVGKERKEGNNTREARVPFDASQIELPSWLDKEAWGRWVADRKDRRKPVTARGAEAQLAKLEEYRAQGHRPEDVIDHSIAGGYQGLFAPAKQKTDSPMYRREGPM